MDESRLAQGEKAYAAGDWRVAAREYLAAVQGSQGEGTGYAFHMAGNALVKLRRNADAATVYGHALKDPGYEKRAAVLTNLGGSLAADGRFSDALAAFDAALSESDNDSRWKAQQGKAGVLYDMGRFEEASQAYRDAAWLEGNPDPGKALNNLGLCFMSLGRPEEAIDAFRAALAMDRYTGKGRASANLGLAYSSMGFQDEAVKAFEAAGDIYAHQLTGPALSAYEAAKASTGPRPQMDKVDGWATGEIPAIVPEQVAEEPAGQNEEDSVDSFFSMTEDEMRVRGRAAMQAERRDKRTPGRLALQIGLTLLAVAVVLGGLATAWSMGLGYPSQGTTVSGMIEAYRAGEDVTRYWVAVPSADVNREMRTLPARFRSYRVDSIQARAASSTAHVKIALEKDGTQSFAVSLVREGVGWKVNGVRNEWRSTGGGN